MVFWKHALKAVRESNVVLEILDARLPEQTRNGELEYRIQRQRKKIIFVLNKSDLVSKKTAEKTKKAKICYNIEVC